MKVLALEVEAEGVTSAQFARFAEAEARRVWELYQNGIIREIYFRADRSEAVLILECADTNEAQHVLESLPLVKAELIQFELIPLAPYPGFARLFNL
jgi:muconolactone delta-isomerase